MADPSPAQSPVPASEPLTATDRMLIDRVNEAIDEGAQLERWCRSTRLNLFPLELNRSFRLPYRAYGFFDNLAISGKPYSVMGCVQDVDFDQVPLAGAAERMEDFVLGYFLPRAHWVYPDGQPGGFGIVQNLYQTVAGQYGKFPPSCAEGCIDWRDLGRTYNWVMTTMLLHDFVMQMAGIKKKLNEAVCGVIHPSFVHITPDAGEHELLDVSIGYPIVRYAPIPNFFGFGPGKFTIAVKLYSFVLSDTGQIKVRMLFAAAPRCEKVFDFGPRIPDPVYGGAELLRRLTFGRWNCQGFHDTLDAKMLAQHCRVHEALMDGTQKVWADWYQNSTQGASA